MGQKKETEFSWTSLFIVTAVSFFMFSAFIKLINGTPAHCGLFFKIGMTALVVGSLSFFNDLTVKPALKKKNMFSNSSPGKKAN